MNVKKKIGRPAFGGIPKKAGQITHDFFIAVFRSNVVARDVIARDVIARDVIARDVIARDVIARRSRSNLRSNLQLTYTRYYDLLYNFPYNQEKNLDDYKTFDAKKLGKIKQGPVRDR